MEATILRGRASTKEPRGKRTLRIELRLPFARVMNLWSGSRVVQSTGRRHNFARELRAFNQRDLNAIQAETINELARRLPRALVEGQRQMRRRRIA